MKKTKKHLAITMTLAMAVLLLAGCGKSEDTNSDSSGETGSTNKTEAGTYYGEIKTIDGNDITISLGELNSDNSSVTLSGEEMTVTVSDDTEISRESAGMGGETAPTDMNSSDTNTPPEKPDGDSTGSEQGAAPGENPGSDNAAGTSDTNTPPEKPDGDSSGSEQGAAPGENPGSGGAANTSDTNTVPKKPDGDSNGNGQAPSDMGGTSETVTVSDLAEGDTVKVVIADDGSLESLTVLTAESGMGGNGGAPGGQSASADVTYTAEKEYTEDTTENDLTATASDADESCIYVHDGATVDVNGATLTADSTENTGGDTASWYGLGAAVLNTEGTLTLTDADISTGAKGGAGVFSYGNGVTYVADSTISTTEGCSGGLHAAGGGTLYAWDCDVTTAGESSAAIRSDKGGGTMVIDGGTYESNGTGSPAIYSTADITVNNADLTANGSEAICIEGKNTIRLFDCNLTGNMSDSSQNDTTWNVILYQSMSGDSEEGNSTFEMVGGTLTAKNGGMFYTTNTQSTFIINNVTIENAENSPYFLQCTGNTNERGWGTSGSNGADCTFTAINQEMTGNVIWDSISSLDFYMTDGSTLTGAFVDDESYAGNGGSGTANLYISEDSTWIVTGDSTLTDLQCAGTILDADGNTVTVKGTDGTVYVEGTSEYTITVASYENTADLSGASVSESYSDFEVTRPENL